MANGTLSLKLYLSYKIWVTLACRRLYVFLSPFYTQISVPHNETDKVDRGGLDKLTLVEVYNCFYVLRYATELAYFHQWWHDNDWKQVGPRFCLNPIKIFGSSFGGPTFYENPFYISPNQVVIDFTLALW